MASRVSSIQRISLICLLLSSGISILWGSRLGYSSTAGLMDFKAIYYGARCVVRHADPYKPADFLRVYQAEGGRFPSDPAQLRLFRPGVTVCINLPTSLLLVAPFALLPWRSASLLWTALMAATLTLSALLVWGLARKNAPRISLFLVWIILANTEILFARGNAAGIAVGLCAIAAWCFLEERFVPAGVVCMAIALATKPQDVGSSGFTSSSQGAPAANARSSPCCP